MGRDDAFKSKSQAAVWLSGVIDGAATLSKRQVGETRGFVREVRITGRDPVLLASLTQALSLLGIEWIQRERVVRSKPVFDLVISRKSNLERFAERVTLRSAKAEVLQEMVSSYIRPGVPDEATLADLVARGLTDPEIARHHGVTPAAVWGWRKKYGIERPALMT